MTTMLNKNALSLKINKSFSNVVLDAPFTPLEQTLKTPVENNPMGYMHQTQAGHMYANPHINESDDILTDIDEPGLTGMPKHYSLSFTPLFDQLVMSIYANIISLPTTTPFLGNTPPSGLVSKVAKETLTRLILEMSMPNPATYDQNMLINSEYLKNHNYRPIFLLLIRKRLLDLCAYQFKLDGGASKLPLSATTSVSVPGNTGNGNAPYSNNIKQTSISSLSLSDTVANSFNSNNTNGSIRSRSSSLGLRKQSLTRNNSYSGNSWLHVGNINNIRQSNHGNAPIYNEGMNVSNDSLHSVPDCVSQSFLNRSVGTPNASINGSFNSNNGCNPMMMGYQTPPMSNKNSTSEGLGSNTSSQSSPTIHIVQTSQDVSNHSDLDYFNFCRPMSKSSDRRLPGPLTINTETLNQPMKLPENGETLNSPFMAPSFSNDNSSPYLNGFQPSPISHETASEYYMEPEYTTPSSAKKETVPVPSQVSLSEKKRESLKLKRGIH